MLDLNTIFGMREQILPQDGLLGFLLQNWLKIAIAVMILGFVIDQVLYIVRYRPQDKAAQMYRGIKNAFLRLSGRESVSENDEEYSEAIELDESIQTPIYRAEKSTSADEDAPVIRRGGAKFSPEIRQPLPKQSGEMTADYEDDDAPLIVRASSGPIRRNLKEPDTHHGEIK